MHLNYKTELFFFNFKKGTRKKFEDFAKTSKTLELGFIL